MCHSMVSAYVKAHNTGLHYVMGHAIINVTERYVLEITIISLIFSRLICVRQNCITEPSYCSVKKTIYILNNNENLTLSTMQIKYIF